MIGLLLLTLGSEGSPASASADVGQPAPALVVDETGRSKFDRAALRGKVLVINFWTTWCPPCCKELPALDAFYTQFHAKGLEMIGLSVDRRQDRKDVERAKQSLNYPVAMLEDAKVDGFPEPSDIPETNRNRCSGVIRAVFAAENDGMTEQRLATAVLPLLSASSASPQAH
jgi:cytochrome c biogenesis protein CcmG, thiol:disulfide interchange protein DsbE